MNVIFRIDEGKCWPLTQRNVTHMLACREQLQQNFHIEVVANGRAAQQLKKETVKRLEYKAAFCDLIKRGTTITACRSVMKGQRMEEQELLNGVATVTSGIMKPAVKQQAGCSHIRP